MTRTPPANVPTRPTGRERAVLRKRVGAFVRKRREELGLSQGDVIRALGYVSRNSVSNIETGREGLPAKRIFAWADVLRVARDPFFRFATGESKKFDGDAGPVPTLAETLTAAEIELLAVYRALSPRLRRQLRSRAKEFSLALR